MPFVPGVDARVLVGGYDLSSYFNQLDVSVEAADLDTTTFGDTARDRTGGLKEGTVSLSGLWDGAANAVDERLQAVLGANTPVSVGFEGFAHGKVVRSLEALDTSYAIPFAVADLVKVEAEMSASGGIDRGLSLHALSAETATGNGTSIDNTAATTNGGVGQLHVTAISGTPTFTAKVQHSTDNSVWVDLITFANASASVTSERKAVTGTVNRYLRATWTVTGGSSPSITFHVSFARR